MADNYFTLSQTQRGDALAVVSMETGRPIYLLEKDVWVVWTLRVLFESEFGKHFIFKGGTSLSKAYDAIDRFSEDIDITYDIRAFAHDIVGDDPDPLPENRSQEHKWTDQIRKRLKEWVASVMLPHIQKQLAETDKDAAAKADGDSIFITYRPTAPTPHYVPPTIKIEFGARSTGEPHEVRHIVADASLLPSVNFPECDAHTMRPERTFWEKATAIHVFCFQGELGGERYSRHWFDLTELDKAGIGERALNDRELANKVAAHKAMFFRETAGGKVIDYRAAVSGKLHLVPEGDAREVLADDYARMLDARLLPENAPTFDQIITQCAKIERRANKTS